MGRRPSVASGRRRRPKADTRIPEGWTPRIVDEASLQAHLERLPEDPGVYIMRDRKGVVCYVGKAKKLRTRVRQYFSGHDTRFFVPALAGLLGDIETVVVDSNKEALLLENNLIKGHNPRFNVKLRDDKQYLVLRLDPRVRWPKLELVRNIEQDGAHYFGPYHSATSARATLRAVNRHFRLRTCTDFTLDHRTRPCLQYQIDRCPAPCVFDVDRDEYDQQVQDVALFLHGRTRELLKRLNDRMGQAAEALEFEQAARVRDQVQAIETALQGQKVVSTSGADQDVFAFYREGGQVEFVVLQVRDGKLLSSRAWSQSGLEFPDVELLGDFVEAYYAESTQIPDEVLVPLELDEERAESLLGDLAERRGRNVQLTCPKRGAKAKLTELAIRNAASNFASRRNRQRDALRAVERLQSRLGLSRLPRVIECFDVSHVQGSDPVASMVVFRDGVPHPSSYRSFKIRGDQGQGAAGGGHDPDARHNDDFASMQEVLTRRFRRALDDDPQWALPDLVVIDGGKGQLGRVRVVLQDLGIELGEQGIDLVSLAKERRNYVGRGRAALKVLKQQTQAPQGDTNTPGARYEAWATATASATEGQAEDGDADSVEVKPERVFVPGVKDALVLRSGSSERHLMERVRDEAHRFAITHHRKRRAKRATKSALDEIAGVGPALKRALVKHFGSVAKIAAASETELCEVRGVGPALAKRLRASLGGLPP